MFDPIRLMNMLKKATDFKQKIEGELKNMQTTGSAGGGIVKIQMNGVFEVEKVFIDPDIFNQKDNKFLEDLIKSSVNDSTKKVKDTLIDKIKDLVGNLNFLK
jgi:hypothetical protein